jgi:uncharacterized protein
MIELIQSFGFTQSEWLISLACGLLIGMAKAGVSGTGLMIVPVMAIVFGGKPSTGIVLPMLIIADLFAVRYYRRYTDWKHVLKLIPWALVGIMIALVVGNLISDSTFKSILSISIICGLFLMIWQDIRKTATIPDNWWFALVLGLAGGFTTMIGNAAGPVLSLYLLSMRIPKYNFIGTAAWFFLLVNLFKVPLHILFWKTITVKTLMFDLLMAPAIIFGVFLGIQIIKIIPEKPYRILVISTCLVSSLLLF